MIDRLLNTGNIALLEKNIRFAQARGKVLADDVVNLSTPNYTPKDLSLEKFQQLMRAQVEAKSDGKDADEAVDDALKGEDAADNILFHDRNNRSVEQLMSDQASNGLMHNLMIELLRKQFSQIQEALKERVS